MGIFNHLSGTTENLLIADKERICKFISSRPANKLITAFADSSGSPGVLTTVTSATHSFEDDDVITITGTTSYNGTFSVQNKTGNTYEIAVVFVADDATGSATQEAFEDLTKNKIRYNKTSQTGDFTPTGGSVIKGASSGATATVATNGFFVDYGTIAGQDAFGTIVFDKGTVAGGPFTVNEDLQNNANALEIVGQAIAANSDEAFTGDNTNFFFTENWDNDGVSQRTYITNNLNPIQIYDGTHLRQLSIDIGTDANRAGINDVTKVLLVIIFKERVVLFNTEESGTSHFQRARWSTIKDPFSWPTANFKDAPTSDIIKSIDFLGDELYVWFEKSTWRFIWTGDSANPFEWEIVSNTEGSAAQMSLVTQDDRQYAVGASRIQVSNGRTVKAADEKIPDFTLDWNQNSLPFSNGILLDEERQVHLTYASDSAMSDDSDQPNDGNVYPDSTLVLNYEDKSFSTFGLPIHTFGFSAIESDLTWDDVTDAWEDIDFAWNAGQAKSGFPTTLFGNHLGKVFQMNFGGADAGSDIEFRAVMAQMNPFVKLGHKAKLGWIEFLADVDANVTFDVKSFLNTDTTEFQTKTVTCDAVRGSDKLVWKRVDVFATANFHRTEITNNASNNRPRLHAIVFYFQDAGGKLT